MATRKESREGFPGEPGEEGTETHGGKGGTGGQGGYGERAHDRAIIVFILIVALVLSTGTAIALKKISDNSSSIEAARDAVDDALTLANKQQDQALVLLRRTNYRICIREQTLRAAVNADKDSDEPQLALYDCRPDLSGGTARKLSRTDASMLARRIKQHHFTP